MSNFKLTAGAVDHQFKEKYARGVSISQNISTPEELKYVTVNKPWGYEYLLYSNSEIAIWLLKLDANAETSMHMHLYKKTTMIPLMGKLTISGTENEHMVEFGDILEICEGTLHKTFASEKSYFLEIEKPNLKLDLLRYEDRYGRDATIYEGKNFYTKNNKNYDFIDLEGDIEEKIIQKYIEDRNIIFSKLNINKLKEQIIKEDIVILIKDLYMDGQLIYSAGQRINQGYLTDLKIDSETTIHTMILRNNNVQQTNTYGYMLSRSLKDHNINAFSSIGELNVHLIEILARIETLNLHLFPTDEIAFESALGYEKITGKKVIFIPGSYGKLSKLFPNFISYWVDSKNAVVLILDSYFTNKSGTNKRQNSIKNFDYVSLLKIITKNLEKIKSEKDFFNKFNKIIRKTYSRNRVGRNGVNVILVPQNIIPKFTNIQVKQTKRNWESKWQALHQKIDYLLNYFSKVKLRMLYLNLIFYKMKRSKKPIIILGDGLKKNTISKKLIAELERMNIPIFTTRSAIDLLQTDSLSFRGRIGGYGNRLANLILNNSDLIISIGARFSTSLTTRNLSDFAKNAFKITIDIDKDEHVNNGINKVHRINFDALQFAELFSDKLSNSQLNYAKWGEKTKNLYEESVRIEHNHSKYNDKNSVYRYLTSITSRLGLNDINVVGGGKILHIINQTAKVKEGQTWINFTSLESDFHTIPTAVGCFMGVAEKLNYQNLGININVFCEEANLFDNFEVLNYINEFKIPIKFYVFREIETFELSYAHRLLYSKSNIGIEFSKRRNLDDFISPLSNFKILNVRENDTKFHANWTEAEPMDVPTIYLINSSQNSNLDPRPYIFRSANGEWQTKSLNEMFPPDKEYDKLRSQLEEFN